MKKVAAKLQFMLVLCKTQQDFQSMKSSHVPQVIQPVNFVKERLLAIPQSPGIQYGMC